MTKHIWRSIIEQYSIIVYKSKGKNRGKRIKYITKYRLVYYNRPIYEVM